MDQGKMWDSPAFRFKFLSLAATNIFIALMFSWHFTAGKVINKTFTKVRSSDTGFNYLSWEGSRKTRTKCASGCLQNLTCNGFIYHEIDSKCWLIEEHCRGSISTPFTGELYSSKGQCPESKGYKYARVGDVCLKCFSVKGGQGSPRKNYSDARQSCQSDGAELLHFEDSYDYNFGRLKTYFPELSVTEMSFWVGLNSLYSEDAGIIFWDHNQKQLMEREMNAIRWANRDPNFTQDNRCVYLKHDLQTFASDVCLKQLGFICVMDV